MAINKKGDSSKALNCQYSLPKVAMIKRGMFDGGIQRTASSMYGSANVTMGPSFFYSPELTPESWLLPKSRQELLKWVKIFYNLEPLVGSITDMHAKYPFSKFKFHCNDKRALEIFNDAFFNLDFDWLQFIYQMSLSYHKYGEAICWGNWNNATRRWDSFICIEPDLMDIKEDPFTGVKSYELIPTIEIKNMVKNSLLKGHSENLPEVLIDSIVNNNKIPLDGDGVPLNNSDGSPYEPPKIFTVARITDPGSTRGTSPIQRLLKVLIFQDKIRLAQIAIADRHHLPIELWTVGHLTGDPKTTILPDENTLNNIREMIRAATTTPPFSIVYSPLLKYEALSVSGKLLSIYEDLGYVENQILVGMGVNKNLILSEGSAFSSSKTIALHRIIMEYQTVRDLFTEAIRKNILLPIAIANNLRDTNGRWIVPEIHWEKSLDPDREKEEREFYLKLWEKGLCSTRTLYSKLPDDFIYEDERVLLESEVNTIFDKKDKRLPQMNLNPLSLAVSPDTSKQPASSPSVKPPTSVSPSVPQGLPKPAPKPLEEPKKEEIKPPEAPATPPPSEKV